jgi:hypothetical protein
MNVWVFGAGTRKLTFAGRQRPDASWQLARREAENSAPSQCLCANWRGRAQSVSPLAASFTPDKSGREHAFSSTQPLLMSIDCAEQCIRPNVEECSPCFYLSSRSAELMMRPQVFPFPSDLDLNTTDPNGIILQRRPTCEVERSIFSVVETFPPLPTAV